MTATDHCRELVGRYADGLASADDVAALEAAVVNDPVIRRLFLRYMRLDAALATAGGDGSGPTRKARPRAGAIAAAATAAMIALAAIAVTREQGRRREPPALATLVAATDAVWSDADAALALHGGLLPAGTLRLDSGTAEFRLATGATLVVRGPAALAVRGPRRLFVERGRVACRCPTAESRLVVETPATEVLDLGTEFAVEVRPDRSTLVAVLSGEVRVGGDAGQRLTSGQAANVRGDGLIVIEPLAAVDFVDLLRAAPAADGADSGANLVDDPGFDRGPAAAWHGTEANVAVASGRTGQAVRVFADGVAHWPFCGQTLETGDVGGRLVVASVWAAPAGGPLLPRQRAMLKLVFVDDDGREFAFAVRRFLDERSPPGRFERGEVAAIAPPGTRRVRVQAMFQTMLRESGGVIFDDAALAVVDAAPHGSQEIEP